MRASIYILLSCFVISIPCPAQKRVITIADLWSIGRVGSFTLSPDGQSIAYTVITNDMEENSHNTDIYLANTIGGLTRQLTTHPAYDGQPCWTPDGSMLSFISTRGGTPQIYVISMTGGEAQKISEIPTGVQDFTWSPDGNYIAFITRVYSNISTLDSCALKDLQQSKNNIKARFFSRLLYRHWDQWTDNKRSHLFVMPIEGSPIWDLTPGDFDTPPISLGSHQDFTFSPDGQEIAFVRNTDQEIALSTNNDIFVVPTKGGTIKRITDNPANDNQPVYSPDNKYIAYRAMKQPGFEADQYDLMVYNREKHTIMNFTEDFDLDVDEIVWAPSSENIYFSAPNHEGIAIFSVDLKSTRIKGKVLEGCNTNFRTSPDESYLYFKRTHIYLPDEIFRWDQKAEDLFQLTFTNHELLDILEMNSIVKFFFPSYDGKNVHGFILKPPFFDPAKVYPAILLIHGGPQSAWQDEFHYRWNAQMFASIGAVVIMINVRGSKGYGQEFCDAVTKNWGGGPYRDLMEGLDFVLKKYPYINPQKLAAAGASYGGYMVNWLAGHTNRFSCLVSHDGISNLQSFYGTTEELWFPEWEFDGPLYENEKTYEKWSPIHYAKNFKTPTLIIHGQQDFRTPLEQGLQMFTALQRQKVPSGLLVFPDEGHFVLKPQNARLWWNTVLGWIQQWTYQDIKK